MQDTQSSHHDVQTRQQIGELTWKICDQTHDRNPLPTIHKLSLNSASKFFAIKKTPTEIISCMYAAKHYEPLLVTENGLCPCCAFQLSVALHKTVADRSGEVEVISWKSRLSKVTPKKTSILWQSTSEPVEKHLFRLVSLHHTHWFQLITVVFWILEVRSWSSWISHIPNSGKLCWWTGILILAAYKYMYL